MSMAKNSLQKLRKKVWGRLQRIETEEGLRRVLSLIEEILERE
jgi:uncharacterized protein YpuA (DUF1002 family)